MTLAWILPTVNAKGTYKVSLQRDITDIIGG